MSQIQHVKHDHWHLSSSSGWLMGEVVRWRRRAVGFHGTRIISYALDVTVYRTFRRKSCDVNIATSLAKTYPPRYKNPSPVTCKQLSCLNMSSLPLVQLGFFSPCFLVCLKVATKYSADGKRVISAIDIGGCSAALLTSWSWEIKSSVMVTWKNTYGSPATSSLSLAQSRTLSRSL